LTTESRNAIWKFPATLFTDMKPLRLQPSSFCIGREGGRGREGGKELHTYLDHRVPKRNVKVARHFIHGHEAIQVAAFPFLHRTDRDGYLEARLALGGGAPKGGREGGVRSCRCFALTRGQASLPPSLSPSLLHFAQRQSLGTVRLQNVLTRITAQRAPVIPPPGGRGLEAGTAVVGGSSSSEGAGFFALEIGGVFEEGEAEEGGREG